MILRVGRLIHHGSTFFSGLRHLNVVFALQFIAAPLLIQAPNPAILTNVYELLPPDLRDRKLDETSAPPPELTLYFLKEQRELAFSYPSYETIHTSNQYQHHAGAMAAEHSVQYLEGLLGRSLRVHTTDSRMFVGIFKCTDAVSKLPPTRPALHIAWSAYHDPLLSYKSHTDRTNTPGA